MTTEVITITISALSLVGTGLQFWLKIQIKNELLQMEKSILTAIEQKHPTREFADERHRNVIERLEKMERQWT